jgi:signal transduction histidine kinase
LLAHDAMPARASSTLPLWMALAIVAVTALAWLDGDRESTAAFEDFSQEQATVALTAAADLSTRLDSIRRDALVMAEDADAARPVSPAVTDGYLHVHVRHAGEPTTTDDASELAFHVPVADDLVVDLALPPVALLGGVRRIERPGELLLLVAAPGARALSTTDGRSVTNDRLVQALASGDVSLRLSREEAAALGLPRRTAVAGLARIDAGPFGRWGVITVASAHDERDRELRARWRLVSSVLLAGGLVFVFGTIALRNQRKELELERVIAVTDVQRQRDERLVRASRVAMMGTLATGVAHEISTPLGIIAGRAEQILARANGASGEERTKKGASAILEQTMRIGDVVRGFLDVARGGRPTLAKVDPAEIVRGAVRLVEHRFEKARVALDVDLAPRLPTLHCDVRLMEHAVVNLLLNGCQASPPGSTVHVVVRHDERRIAFVVIDEGTGISAEDAAHAIEPFFTTKPQGTGLGLAITNEIVKAHRGSLSLGPASPHGTRACIDLPIEPEDAASA